MSLLIGFGYESQHGKDTAAETILVERGDKYSIKRIAFADILKIEAFHALVNRNDPFWYFCEKAGLGTVYYDSILIPKPANPFISNPAEKIAWINENKVALRYLLQVYGTEYRRKSDPFYWVRALGNAINLDPPQVVLIPDMRFLNETFFIKANEGFTVKVHREGYTNTGASGHVSEQQLANYAFDYTISVPEGHLDELRNDALEVFDSIIENVTPKDIPTSEFTEAAFSEAA